ncbi:hypothetical protein KSS87_014828, partial [Heliosperma pusillum]
FFFFFIFFCLFCLYSFFHILFISLLFYTKRIQLKEYNNLNMQLFNNPKL